MVAFLRIGLINRSLILQNTLIKQQTRLSSNKNDSSSSDSSSSDSSDSDNEQVKPIKKKFDNTVRSEEAKQDTANILNNLLAQMNKDKLVSKTTDYAVPKKKSFLKQIKKISLEENIQAAAKEVASSLGGDVEQKEKDLLGKVFSAGVPAPEVNTENLETTSNQSLGELLSGMKIDNKKKPRTSNDIPYSRTTKIQDLARKFQNGHKYDKMNQGNISQSRFKPEPVDLFGGRPLNVFDKNVTPSNETVTLTTWENLHNKKLKSMLVHPPENYFQELIQWTDRGLIWKFPIDNEQGLEAEQSIHFSEHVFLEKHLKGWCPQKGPIRHFMELVCVGLSKNPYMTVEEKKEHIFWFREYFGLNQDLLKELNCIQDDIPVDVPKDKNLFAITAS